MAVVFGVFGGGGGFFAFEEAQGVALDVHNLNMDTIIVVLARTCWTRRRRCSGIWPREGRYAGRGSHVVGLRESRPAIP